MPFTPYHFGPGLLIKAAAPRWFSLSAYVAAQVAIDVESGFYLFTGQPPYHRTAHTFVVGAVVGAVAGIAIGAAARRFAGRLPPDIPPGAVRDLQTIPAVAGGVIGGLSHVLLDGVMHADIHPFRPFSDLNPLLRLVDLTTLHLICLLSGVLGILWLAYRGYRAESQRSNG